MRKAFNFYRSYYEVSKELNDKEFASFIRALLQKQFEGIEPTQLTGMAKFAYISQQHSIDSQVIGYETKTGVKIHPMQGGSVGGSLGGSVQGEEKEKGEEKVQLGKHLFKNSLIFDKVKFAQQFPTWDKDKLKHYYESANDYSESKGAMYKDWVAAIRSWERKDVKDGKWALKLDTRRRGLI